MSDAYTNIISLLEERKITPVVIRHPPVVTCEQADLYTPDPAAGLKSLILETASKLHMVCVLLGSQKVDFKRLRELTGERVHMMPEESACALVGCEEGSVPPFGHRESIGADARGCDERDGGARVMPIYVDHAVATHPVLYFNPGKNTETFGVKLDDLMLIFSRIGAIFSDIAKKE